KMDVADMRESPALKVIDRLLRKGALVEYHDPFISEFRSAAGSLRSVPLTGETLRAADCVLVLTDHTELPWQLIAAQRSLVLDTPNALKHHRQPNIIRL